MQLTISSPVIWLYPEKVDFRKSIDGLSELIHACDLGDVYKDIFVFASRRVDKLKILAWHKNGFVLLYKRLKKKRFTFKFDTNTVLNEKQFSWLLAGLYWITMGEFDELKHESFF